MAEADHRAGRSGLQDNIVMVKGRMKRVSPQGAAPQRKTWGEGGCPGVLRAWGWGEWTIKRKENVLRTSFSDMAVLPRT